MLDLDTVRDGLGETVAGDAIILLRIQHPPARDVRDWLSNREEWCDRTDVLSSLERRIKSSEYLRRPFFISKIADLGPDHFQGAQGEPIAELMESIVRREGEKLTGVSADISTELAMYEHFKETRLFEGVSDWMAQRSRMSGRNDAVADERWYLLEKFARISMRQYSIRSVEDQMDPASGRIIASPQWSELRTLLERHERLEVNKTLPASGPKSEWFHLVAGEEFLNPGQASKESTRRILEELNVDSWREC